MSEYEINTNKENREEIIKLIDSLGVIVEKWKDGSFNFQTYNNDCEDELIEVMDKSQIEYRLV